MAGTDHTAWILKPETGEDISILTSGNIPLPDGPWSLVNDRFQSTLANSEDMLERLVGEGGYLDQMAEVIGDVPDTSVVAPDVDTGVALLNSGLSIPGFNRNHLGTFPEETYSLLPLSPLPVISTDGIDAVQSPGVMADATLQWDPSLFSSDVYAALLSRILSDLQHGATGLTPEVEQAIYDRAKARQLVDRQQEYEKINATWTGKQFMLPSGSLVSALIDFSIAANRQDADIENQIIITQAELAQKNSQFIIQQAGALEQIIRQAYSDQENRTLDFEKHRVDVLIREYAERVRAYAAELDAEKAKVQATVEALRGAIESNKAKVDVYKEQYAALAVRIGAVAAKNESLVKVFQSEVQGYAEAERAVAAQNESRIRHLTAKISKADLDLRASVAQAEVTMAGYTAETGIRERIATSMANIAAQAVASWASAVSASAGLSYSGSAAISESRSQSKSINHSHSYEHDPLS
jgi:hypothetical protein